MAIKTLKELKTLSDHAVTKNDWMSIAFDALDTLENMASQKVLTDLRIKNLERNQLQAPST